jgi:uncharacterized protein with GYD domain
MKYVTFIKLSAEGRKRFPEASALFTTTLDIVDKFGGKVLDTWAIAGVYDFVSIVEYPTNEVVFEARLKMYELGIFEMLESYEAFDMDFFLAKV